MSFFAKKAGPAAKTYVVCFSALGLASVLHSLTQLGEERLSWIALLILTVAGSFFPIRIPTFGRHQGFVVTFGDVFLFLAVLLYIPAVAVCVAFVDSTIANTRNFVKTWDKVFFNISQYAVSAYIAAHLFYYLRGGEVPVDFSQNTFAVLFDFVVTVLVLYVLNFGMITVAMTLYTGRSPLQIWRKGALRTVLGSSSGAFVAILIVLNSSNNVYLTVAMAGPVALITYWAVRIYQHHVEELIRAREFLQSILNSVSTYIAILDARGVIVAVNRLWEEFPHKSPTLGPTGCTGDSFPELLKTAVSNEDEQADEIIGAVADMANASIKDFSIEYSTGGGRNRRWFSLQMSRFLDDAEVRVVLEFSDITARKGLEDQLRHAQKMEAIGRLAGGVAHDFNNILTIIAGYGTFLQEAVSDDKMRSHVETILEAADRAGAVTRQLLAFSRKQVLEPQVIEVNQLVSDTDQLLRRLIGEDIDLVTDLDPEAGRIRVDPGQFSQVLMNLAVNARDAMPGGGRIQIKTSTAYLTGEDFDSAARVQPGLYACLKVADTGDGMDRETLDHIFEPFYTTKEKGKGTGLGLSTVYGIIKQSDGHIEVRSEPKKGTAFEIFLPRIDADSEFEPTPSRKRSDEVRILTSRSKSAKSKSSISRSDEPPREAIG